MWISKFISYLLISSGLVLLFLPIPETMTEKIEGDFLALSTYPQPISLQKAQELYPNRLILLRNRDIGYENEFNVLQQSSGRKTISRKAWEKLVTGIEKPTVDPIGVGILQRLTEISNVDLDHGLEVQFDLSEALFFEHPSLQPILKLSKSDLKSFPRVLEVLEKMALQQPPNYLVTDLPSDIWIQLFQHFARKDFNPNKEYFIYKNQLFKRYQNGYFERERHLSTEKKTIASLGTISLILGLFVFLKFYRSGSNRLEICISPLWFQLFTDAISLAGGVFLFGLCLDAFWVSNLRQASFFGLDPDYLVTTAPITALHFVAILGLFLAFPLVTMVFVSLSSQRVLIDPKGVASRGALFTIRLNWKDIKSVSLEAQSNPVKFSVNDFRDLQTVLAVRGDDITLYINEPPTSHKKRRIIEAFKAHCPADKQDCLAWTKVGWS